MRINKINKVLLMGGSPLLAELAKYLKSTGKYAVTCFTCQRQLDENISEGRTLKDALKEAEVKCYCPENICSDKNFTSRITDSTLALGFGEVWNFNKATVDKFNGRLLDFMGIPLPKYRGGAHYSWLILRQSKKWGCNIQLINEDMVQGIYDSGELIKSKEYSFPESARIPQDYFDAAVQEEMKFLREFFLEIEQGKDFKVSLINEDSSMYFPRLYTMENGWINWEWKTKDIESFVCAFDEPYAGASTFLGEQRVFLKDCHAESEDGKFHPFMAGLVYRKTNEAIYVATVDGSIMSRKVRDEKGAGILHSINVGQRLMTPREILEQSMYYQAEYDKDGIVEGEISDE